MILQVFNYLILLEDDLLQGVDAAFLFSCLGAEYLHLLLCHLQLPLEGCNLLVLLLETLEGLLVDFLERLLNLSLFIESLLPFRLTTSFLVPEEVDLDYLVVPDHDRCLRGAGCLPELLVGLALHAIHLHLSLHNVVVLRFQIVLLALELLTLLELVRDLELQAIIGLHECLDLILQLRVLRLLLLPRFLQLLSIARFKRLLLLEQLGDFLLQAFPRLLQALPLRHQRVIHILELLQLLVLFFVLPHLLHVSFLLACPLLVLQQRYVLLFYLLELGVLALELLALGSERHHLFLFLLKVLLLLLELFLVVILVLGDLSHLSLLLFHELFVVLQLLLQVLDLVLLFLELRLDGIVLGLGNSHGLLNEFQILHQLIILGVHLLDPTLQVGLLVVDDLLVLQQLVPLGLQLLDLILHFGQLVLQGLVLVGVARLELLDDVLVALDRARHFLLQVVELPFEFLGFPLLQADLHDLLVEVMLDELHFEKDIACLVDPILGRVKISLVPLLLGVGGILLVFETLGVKLRVLRVHGDDLALVLVLHGVDDLGVNEVALGSKALDGKTDEVA